MKRKNQHRHDIRFDGDLELEAAILEQGGDFSKVVRRLCRAGLSVGTIDLDTYNQILEQLEAVRKEVAPIGGNLNQIAKGFNIDGHLYGEDLAAVHSDLQRQFREMTTILKELRIGINKHIR